MLPEGMDMQNRVDHKRSLPAAAAALRSRATPTECDMETVCLLSVHIGCAWPAATFSSDVLLLLTAQTNSQPAFVTHVDKQHKTNKHCKLSAGI
jgi:hypothetical protein